MFKCFRKTGCESLPCQELSSCKVFQEFMLRLDLFCNSTSGYEISDLRLLSWFICLLWLCHELPKRETVKDIFYVIGQSFDKMHFTCNLVDLGWFKYFKKQVFKFSIEVMQIWPRNMWKICCLLKLDRSLDRILSIEN